MASRIDRTFGFVLLLALGYLLFQFATGSFLPALLCTFLLGCLIYACDRAWHARYGHLRDATRVRVRDARALVEHWALEPDEHTAEAHVRARYGEEAPYAFTLLSRHPAGRALDANELLALWRTYEGHERLVAAATAPIDPSAHALADRLIAPHVRLLDADALVNAVCRSSIDIPHAPVKRRWWSCPRVIPSRKRAPLCIAYALFMLVAFWILGAPAYLIAALLLMALGALGLKKRKPPETLF